MARSWFSRRPKAFALVLATASALVFALSVGGARSAGDAPGLIAFARGNGVYVVNANGSDAHLLWHGGRDEWVLDVAWSPDGGKLAFGTAVRIVVMNADGGEPTRIAKLGAWSLTWSPDGRKIAFTGLVGPGEGLEKMDVALMNADGSDLRRLTRTPRFWENNVDWSPAGGRLAFDRGGPYMPPVSRRVYTMKADGSDLRRLHPDPWPVRYRRSSWSEAPDWSPDGRRIAFSYYNPYSYQGSDVWVMNAAGKGLVKLTQNVVFDNTPVWSPDGKRIAFARERSVTTIGSAIVVMDADGAGQKVLTHGDEEGYEDRNPAWQPVPSS